MDNIFWKCRDCHYKTNNNDIVYCPRCNGFLEMRCKILNAKEIKPIKLIAE